MSTHTVTIGKSGVSYDFDTETLPAQSLAYLVEYGLKQSLNDVHAAVARKNFKTDEEFVESVNGKVATRVQQIVSGDVPGSRAPRTNVKQTAAKLLAEMSIEQLEALLVEKRAALAA